MSITVIIVVFFIIVEVPAVESNEINIDVKVKCDSSGSDHEDSDERPSKHAMTTRMHCVYITKNFVPKLQYSATLIIRTVLVTSIKIRSVTEFVWITCDSE